MHRLVIFLNNKIEMVSITLTFDLLKSK